MSDLKNNTSHSSKNSLTRYQNPELFEQLAIEYAVGSLHGRARKRFEVLMETHFYLKAVVDAYEQKFANLVELLPDEQPSNQVWKNIEAHINASTQAVSNTQETKQSWWQGSFFKQGFSMAAMALIVSAVLIWNPMTGTPVATAYTAVLESGAGGAMAVTKIQKSNMKLSIDIMKPVIVAEGMELTLWCHPRDGGMPMKMGVISQTGKTEIKISKKEWQSMKNVGQLAISIEHKDSYKIKEPTGKIILKGQLSSND
jgi:anti-sigma-K factor RskA